MRIGIYAGQYYDVETGLHYNYHRYYDPKTGRYLTPDPIGLAGGINLYVYGDGNPIRYTDMLGLTRDDVYAAYQHIIENVRGINPSKGWFYPILPLVAFDSDLPDASDDAYTERFWGRPVLPDEYLCNLSEDQFLEMYATLLHEMMHSTDTIRQRRYDAINENNPHHISIFMRVRWEMGESVLGEFNEGSSANDIIMKVKPMWGLTQQYLQGTRINPNNILQKVKDLYKATRY